MMARTMAILWDSWIERRDEEAFARLVRPEIPHALAAAGRAGLALSAEDIVQDCLVALARVRNRRPAEVGIRAWLIRAATLRARTVSRSARRRLQREQSAPSPSDTPSSGRRAEVQDEVEVALAALPERDREAVLLRYLHDLEYEEVARVLGSSPGAARVRVHRAIARLRRRLGPSVAALLATLVLPAAHSEAALVGSALAKAAIAPALGTVLVGGVVMKTVTKVVLVGVVLATTAATAIVFSGGRGSDGRGAPSREVALVRDLRERNAALEQEVDRLRDDLAAATGAATENVTRPGSPMPVSRAESHAAANPTAGKWSEDDSEKCRSLMGRWRRDIQQIHDGALRATATREVLDALYENDPVRNSAAVNTLSQLKGVEYDRERARKRVLTFFESQYSQLRADAAGNLYLLKPSSRDVQHLLPMVKDSNQFVRLAAVGAIARLDGRAVVGPAADAILVALGDPDMGMVLEHLISIARTERISSRLEARLVELASSEDQKVRTMAITALGGVRVSSPGIVDALLRIMAADTRDSATAAAHLLYRLPEGLRERVLEGTLEILAKRGLSSDMRCSCVAVVGGLGSPRHIPTLEAILANELATSRDISAAKRAIQSIRRRIEEER